MKFLAKTLLLTAALAAGSVYAKCGGEIKFAQGKSETTIKGSVAGRNVCEYTFYAKAGQRLRTTMGSGHPYAVLWEPVNEGLINGQYFRLPKTGKYVLRVLLPRNEARKSSTKAHDFTLRFEIK